MKKFTYEIIQQTPNPDAHFPSIFPDFAPQSSALKQIPLIDLSVATVHSSFGNWTTEKMDNCSMMICKEIFIFKLSSCLKSTLADLTFCFYEIS